MKDSSGSDKWKHDTWPDHRNPGKLSRSYHQYVLFKNDDFAVSVLDKIKKLDEVLLDYCKKYDVELLEHETPRAMIYEPGCFFGAHKDDTFSHPRRVSTVLYINDDYAGGEIFFPLIIISLTKFCSFCLIKDTFVLLKIYPNNFVYEVFIFFIDANFIVTNDKNDRIEKKGFKPRL
jgi:hypothetical protein